METNENTTVPNLRDAAQAVLSRKCRAAPAHLKKQEKFQVNNLTLHLKELQKESMKTKTSRREEIMKMTAEINKIQNYKTIEHISETKSWSFEKMKKINKPLARLKTERERI